VLLSALGFVALLAVAAAVRLWMASRAHLWFDELYTLEVARRPLPELLRIVGTDVHPPLHFLLVSAWRALGGDGDLWIKSLSVVFGLIGIALLVPMGRDLFSRPAGWLAAVLLALHPAHVDFSQESRSFILLFLFVTIATWSAWRWLENERPADAVTYALSATAAMWTHYLAGLVLACLCIWGLLDLRERRDRVLPWLGLHLAAALMFAPQVPTLLVQLTRRGQDTWVKQATASTLVNFFRQLCTGPSYLVPLLIVLAALPLLRRQQRRAASLLWSTSLVPVVGLWALSMRGGALFLERYMFFSLPAFALLVAAGVTGLRWRWAGAALAAVLVVLFARSVMLHAPQGEADALERADRWLASRVQPGDLVVHADAHSLAYARRRALDRGTHVLLMTRTVLPYYEGEQVIPADWRIDPAAFAHDTLGGRRWWGYHEEYGYAGSEPAAEMLREGARGDSIRLGRVRIWAGTAVQSMH
jgi:mannosyltransferase